MEASDSIESKDWSKQFLTDGQANVDLTANSPALATGFPDVPAKVTISRTPLLRREFNLAGEVRRATLYASARGLYDVHINGQKSRR